MAINRYHYTVKFTQNTNKILSAFDYITLLLRKIKTSGPSNHFVSLSFFLILVVDLKGHCSDLADRRHLKHELSKSKQRRPRYSDISCQVQVKRSQNAGSYISHNAPQWHLWFSPFLAGHCLHLSSLMPHFYQRTPATNYL